MKRIMFPLIICLLLVPGLAGAINYMEEVDQIKQFNPDVEKYHYVKTYLNALTYLKRNDERNLLSPEIHFDDLQSDLPYIATMVANIVHNNTNLRIARNLLQKYDQTPNGLILKSNQVFKKSCEQLIALNTTEMKSLQKIYMVLQSGELSPLELEAFQTEIQAIDQKRKEALKEILFASMLVGDILISAQTDDYGDLFQLGIDEEERNKLLDQLNYFKEAGYQGRLRNGQSFIQASIAVIRDRLEDYSWMTKDMGGLFIESDFSK